MANNIINSISDNQMNYLTPTPIKSITSDLIDYQGNDLGYDLINTNDQSNQQMDDLFFDQLLNQIRDLMPDQLDDLSNDQALDLITKSVI